MKQIWKRSMLIALAFAALMSVHSQNESTSKSATIQIVAVVPSVLRLSLDFSPDATAQLTGYIPGSTTLKSNVSFGRSKDARFEIRAGTTVDIGNASIFSNISSSYSVEVFSSNGGSLRDPSLATNASIPYQLLLGDNATTARGGSFTFIKSGKSTKSGSPLRVALMIADVPATALSGLYTDQLMFSISAN